MALWSIFQENKRREMLFFFLSTLSPKRQRNKREHRRNSIRKAAKSLRPLMELSRSFTLNGGARGPPHISALRRYNSSTLVSESITAECARFAPYERLSESMRLISSGRDTSCLGHFGRKNKKGTRALALLGKIFSLRKQADDGADQRSKTAAPELKKLKKRSSWLPDRERRWPVQGW